MEFHYLITVPGMVLCGYTLLHLWNNRDNPGAGASALTYLAVLTYAVTAYLDEATLFSAQTGYVAGAVITPLLLVAVTEYAHFGMRGWHVLRWLIVGAPLACGLLVLGGDRAEMLLAIAREPVSEVRVALIREARHGSLAFTTFLTYAFTLVTLVVAGGRLFSTPGQRLEMLMVLLVPALVMASEISYYTAGFTVVGLAPTPLALLIAITALILSMYRSRVVDLRPVARSTLIDTVRDCMLVVDEKRRVVDCNRAAEQYLLLTKTAILGRPVNEVAPSEIAALLQSRAHLRSEIETRDAPALRWLEVDVTPLVIHGRSSGHLIIARDITERREAQEALHKSRRALEVANTQLLEQSVTDSLTGLRNRRCLFERLDQEVRRHQRSGQVLGLLVLDIDHFKVVNDTHGHPVGDRALRHVAQIIAEVVRESDLAARVGGEEFAIIAMDTDAEGLMTLAERLRQAVSDRPVAHDGTRPVRLTASIGIAYAEGHEADSDRLFAEADRYLYQAKHRGRNCVVGGPVSVAVGRAAG